MFAHTRILFVIYHLVFFFLLFSSFLLDDLPFDNIAEPTGELENVNCNGSRFKVSREIALDIFCHLMETMLKHGDEDI